MFLIPCPHENLRVDAVSHAERDAQVEEGCARTPPTEWGGPSERRTPGPRNPV